MTNYIETKEIDQENNMAFAFLLNYVSDIVCKYMIEILNNDSYITNKSEFNSFITFLDFFHNLCSNIYLNIAQKPGDYCITPDMEDSEKWEEQIDTSGDLEYLNIIELPNEIFDRKEAREYTLSYGNIEERFSNIYEDLVEVSTKLNEFQNLKANLNSLSPYQYDFIKFVEALLDESSNIKNSLISKLNSTQQITSRNIKEIAKASPEAIKIANSMFTHGKLDKIQQINNKLKNAQIGIQYLTFGTEFDKPSGEYGDERAKNISILEHYELKKFIYIIKQHDFNIGGIVKDIHDEINDYHKKQRLIYPLLDECIDKDGNLLQQDTEAIKIMDGLWRNISHDINSNTLNVLKKKDTGDEYMLAVLCQKLVDYIKYKGLDKDGVDGEIISRFVDDISKEYGTNTPELEINEMQYSQFCKTLLKKYVNKITQSKSSQILLCLLYSVNNLSDLVANWIIDAGKSVYMPAELKKFYTNETFKTFKKDLKTFNKNFEAFKKNFNASRNIISQEEQKPDSCLQNIEIRTGKRKASDANIKH